LSDSKIGAGELKLYREAAAAALLWYYRLHPRSISSAAEDVPDSAHGEIAFGAMVSHTPVSLPEGTSLEVADRFWSANLYKAEAAAYLAIAPREAERRLLAQRQGTGTRPAELSANERGTLARAAEALGVPDRQAWFQLIKDKVDSLFNVPQIWNGVEGLVTMASGRGALSEQDVEHFLERAGVPQAPWPEWMPGNEPRSGFYFD
jgi:hypothetical protein